MSNFLFLQKINFNIEYLGRIKSTEIAPYKTIEYLINIIKNLFYPITSKIKILYNQNDIIPYSKYILVEFFKLKNKINLKIVSQNYNRDSNIILNQKKYTFTSDESDFLCECGNDIISNYCRDCKSFICNICKINQIHENHRTITINTNDLVESIKTYAKTLTNEVNKNIKKTEYFSKKIGKEEYDIDNRHKIIKEKFDKIFQMYNEIINNLKEKNDVDTLMEKYKTDTKNTNEQIEKILMTIYRKYTKSKRQMNYEEFKKYFDEISQKDDLLENQSIDLIKIRVKYDFNERMTLIYNKIEQIIDIILNGKNILNMNNQTNYLYNLILEKQEKRKEEEEEEQKKNNDSNKNEEEENNDSENENFENEDSENEESSN